MAQSDKLVYPPGVKEILEDLSTDELIRRLKDCATAFQSLSQEDDNSKYIPLALHLASEAFMQHDSFDVQMYVACCIADVFRVYAPEAPYKDALQLTVIFEFFVDQLARIEKVSKDDPTFKHYFYLLENFSCVKTFNICMELEDNQKILCHLFKLMFRIINEKLLQKIKINNPDKMKTLIVDMLSPLIADADTVSQELLDIILTQIIEPTKSKNKNACSAATEVLIRNVQTLEPYIQCFFNNALLLGKTLESDLARHLYELIYELNLICPSMLSLVLPQLEFKLKNNDEQERLDVTTLLGRMFSDKKSIMIDQNRSLWICFLNRFNDISPNVRICCVQYCKSFLLYHKTVQADITEQLKLRHRDSDENVRFEAVSAIVNTAKEDFDSINEDLFKFLKERTLDKKFKIRKEALLGLSMVYKKNVLDKTLNKFQIDAISWIRNKVLHAYYQTSLEDRLLVERILFSCLVPYQEPLEQRMKLLYLLFCTIDDHAIKAFKEMMKCQSVLRKQVKDILEEIQSEKNENKRKLIDSKVAVLSKNLPDPVKARESIMKFCTELESNLRLRNYMSAVVGGNISCSQAEANLKEILKLFRPSNQFYGLIKQLLERIAPVMIDKEGVNHLIDFVKDSLLGDGAIESDLGLENSARKGLELIWVFTFIFPTNFHDEHIYNNLLLFLNAQDDVVADITLQIFVNISSDLETNYPEIYVKLLPILENFIETGTSKQAKHAVYCIHNIVSDKEKVFGDIIENLKKHFTFESQYFRTALVSVGHIAYLCHDMFAADFKTIVAKIVVKDLLMLDQDLPRGGDETWGPLDSLPDETKVKIEGMKVMVRWLAGLKDMVQPAMSTLRLLTTVILHDGDLMERKYTAPVENSWMRLSAANCMLKLCQEPNYANVITLDQFQVLAYVMIDKCPEVRERFAQKVHKGLFSLKLPLDFLAILCYGALDERKEFQKQVKSYIAANINKRKEYIKHRTLPVEQYRQILPDYAIPHAIHLLAHSPFLKTYSEVPALKQIKECLWFLMEPLMVKNENYSYSFFKRLIENIKQTKDKQAPNDNSTNMKLYAVCDLALSIVMSKSSNFVLKDFPAEPVLPEKLFTDQDLSYSNVKTYLPAELISAHPLKQGFEIEIFEDLKDKGSPSETDISAVIDTCVNISQSEDDTSSVTSKGKKNAEENNTADSRTTRMNSRAKRKKDQKERDSEDPSEESEESSDKAESVTERTKSKSSSKQNNSKQNGSHEPVKSDTSVSSKSKQRNVKKVEAQQRLTRSSRLTSTSSVKSNECESSDKQNGVASDLDTSLNTSDVQGSLKECNVSLRKDEVEKYIALNNSISDSHDENDLSEEEEEDDAQRQTTTRNRSSKLMNSPSLLKKRKRADSPVSRSVKSKISSRLTDKHLNSSSQPSKPKSSLKSHSAVSLTRSNSSLKKGNKSPLVNGKTGSKVSQKRSSPPKYESPLTRNQRNQMKTNLRKR